MRVQIFKYWSLLRSSFWFLPSLMAVGAVVLAFAAVALETPATNWLLHRWGWAFTGGAAGATAVLSTLTGSMITIAGVVFSMTLVTLSLASSQLGPRLLRNFIRDTITQMVLGTFVASFLYCLLVLRTIRRVEEVVFVPHVAILLGVLLAVVSVVVLIYFIHHVSVSIQVNETVARVSKELIEGIERLFPLQIGQKSSTSPGQPPDADLLAKLGREARPVTATEDGYLQFIDGEALIEMALEEDIVLLLERKPGDYVIVGRPLMLVWPGDRVNDELTKKLNSAFVMGNQRTPDQDIECAVDQLVEIAARALSPGINDPFTAIACVDHLGSALCRLAKRDPPLPYRYDGQSRLRVIAPVTTFPGVADAALNQIRQYGRSSAAVTIRLLETVTVVAAFTKRPEDRAALLRHARMISRGAQGGLSEEEDRQAVNERYQAAIKLLAEPAGADHPSHVARAPG